MSLEINRRASCRHARLGASLSTVVEPYGMRFVPPQYRVLGTVQPKENFFCGATGKTIGTKPHGQLSQSMLTVPVRIFGSSLVLQFRS